MDKEFAESYNTIEWKRKRKWILRRDGHKCQICGDSAKEVHHITYKHCNGKAYNALDGDLIALCHACHKHDDGDHIHFFNGKYAIVAGEWKPEVYYEAKVLWRAETIYCRLDDIMVECDGLLTDLKYAGKRQNISQREEDIIAWIDCVLDHCHYLVSKYIDVKEKAKKEYHSQQ